MAGIGDFYIGKVSSFLKTVVCFDDQAGFECSIDSEIKVAQTAEDGFYDETEQPADRSADEIKNGEPPNELSCLDAKALTEAFAKRAILCSVMKPSGEAPDIEKQIVSLAGAADVLVLDWILADKDPTIARDAITGILREDKNNGGRLRLIVVYSVQPGDDVVKQLIEVLGPVGFKQSENALLIPNGHSLIVVFQKPGTFVPKSPIVEYEDLPQKVIESFTTLTSGLLPAATLSAITAIREKTHHLLATFPGTLDAAFLTHRCLIPDPNDAELFLLDLLESEIGTLLRQSNISECVDSIRCKEWIDSKPNLVKKERDALITAVTKYSRNSKLEKIKKGFKLDKETSDRQIADEVSDRLCKANQCDTNSSREDLSILATLAVPRKHSPIEVFGSPPKLRLGVIVKDDAKRYMICIQPLCDSVRISNNRDTEYPFLILDHQDTGGGKDSLDLCLPLRDGSVIWLRVSPFPRNMISYPFKPKSTTEAYVEGMASQNSFMFNTSTGPKLEYVAELKIGKAQRIVSQLAARIHTLGIEEFEWMRLHQS